MHRRLVPLLAVSVMATLAPALGTAPAAAAPSGESSVADAYARQSLDWKSCAPQAPAIIQCATVEVPLDHRKPRGEKIEVAVSRIKASDAGQRRGVLLFNPGGPGGEGLAMPLEMKDKLPASVLDRYDFIGFDPRGIGRSTPVACGLVGDEHRWPRPHRAFDENVAWAKGLADKCRTAGGKKLPHLTTRNTARDMDVIRAALGEKKINYLGYSYGTYLGSVYTQMFPKRSDRIVLDSAVDPKLAWRATFQKWGPEVEPAFRRWAAWTAKRPAEYGLGDTAAEVRKTFRDLVAQADRTPILVGKTPLTGVDIRSLVRSEFFTVRSAAYWVSLFKDAADGKPTPDLPSWPGPEDNNSSALWSVLCGDTDWQRDPEVYREDSRRDAARYPVYGDFASGITPCAFWGKAVEPATTVNNKVEALILQNEWDSQTPLSTARGMHRALKASRLVTVDEGEGHGVYGYGGNACADGAATTYLNTGELPAGNVTCQAVAGRQRAQTDSLPSPELPLTVHRF